MRVVVVKASTVPEHQVAVHRIRREPALSVLDEVVYFVAILHEFFDPESAGVAVRILALVIPTAPYAWSRSGSDQRNRLGHDVQSLWAFAGDPDFGFCAELNFKSLMHGLITSRWPCRLNGGGVSALLAGAVRR